jgi:hypothetical protein
LGAEEPNYRHGRLLRMRQRRPRRRAPESRNELSAFDHSITLMSWLIGLEHFRSSLRPNQISFLHSLGHEATC